MGLSIEIPDELGKRLLSTAGVDKRDLDSGDFAITAIELDALGLAGTCCGDVGNQPFDIDVLNLLNSVGVSFVIAVLDKQLRICAMAARISAKAADILSAKIEENGGSLRADEGPEGWSIFESE